MKALTDDTFEDTVLTSDIPVLVDFWAEWCGPCKKMTPILEDVEKQLQGTALLASVNVDEQRNLAASYKIMSIPTMIIFKNGTPVKTMTGVKSAKRVIAALQAQM